MMKKGRNKLVTDFREMIVLGQMYLKCDSYVSEAWLDKKKLVR